VSTPGARTAVVKELAADVVLVALCVAFLVFEMRDGRFEGLVPFLIAGAAVLAVARLVRTGVTLGTHGAAAALDPLPETALDAQRADPCEHDRFLVAQAITPLVNRYEVATADERGRAAQPVLYVEQARFKLREELTFYADSTKAEPLLRLKARQVIDVAARYDVTTRDGEHLGHLQKAFGQSLLRSTWEAHAADGALLATARERNLVVALWRRLVDLIPVAGELLGLLPIPYHFDLRAPGSRRLLGSLTRRRTIRDQYVLDLTGDPDHALDRRLAIALAVGLDALQAR
jgi:hypothetical protein